MLPKIFDEWVIVRPTDRNEKEVQTRIAKFIEDGYSREYFEKKIITKKEAQSALTMMGINHNSAFYEFYSKFSSVDSSERDDAELMYDLNEVLENYQQPFWGRKYPGIEKRYLQLSSIEGEYSYFYDKETDALYGVDWKDMDDFMAGKLQPLFTSFYDFLEWYYGESDEA